jgi:uncharacterized protein (DUF697 family)
MTDWKLTGLIFAVFVVLGLALRSVMPDTISFVGPWIAGLVAALLVLTARRLTARRS